MPITKKCFFIRYPLFLMKQAKSRLRDSRENHSRTVVPSLNGHGSRHATEKRILGESPMRCQICCNLQKSIGSTIPDTGESVRLHPAARPSSRRHQPFIREWTKKHVSSFVFPSGTSTTNDSITSVPGLPSITSGWTKLQSLSTGSSRKPRFDINFSKTPYSKAISPHHTPTNKRLVPLWPIEPPNQRPYLTNQHQNFTTIQILKEINSEIHPNIFRDRIDSPRFTKQIKRSVQSTT
ncbi:hypothetical protein SDJN02_24027, partial [Cucurbita argyrosperma subsp. argyrosperma]